MARVITSVLLVLFLGLHWTLLQSIAWTGMIVRYSQDAPLKQALAKTFNGKHPCQMCHLVQEGRKAEQSKDPKQLRVSTKLDCGLIWQEPEVLFASIRCRIPSSRSNAEPRPEAPPKPPPRFVG